MPLELSVWRIDGRLERVDVTKLDLESRLEDILARDISVASPHWMVIGRQVPTPWGKLIDLLCIDGEGKLIVLELKRHMTEREVIAQALDYGSYVKTIQADEVRRIFAEYQKKYKADIIAKTIEDAFREHFVGQTAPEELNTSHELVIVAASLDGATERIVSYLADEYGVRINAVFFRVFRDGEREYLTRAWLRDTEEIEGASPTSPGVRERVPFNGEYYVNFGDGVYRNWEDARRFGFVSAGHGKVNREAMQRLEPGNRIWVNVPGRGYVGVGVVEEAAVPVNDFVVHDGSADAVPLLKAGIACDRMNKDADDPELSEYVARVRWIKTVSIDDAVRERGLFGVPNCVAEPRSLKWPYTIDRLKQHFAVTD